VSQDYYYFDGLGSTVMLTQGLSTITDRYDYDAWGNEYPIMVSTADNPYRYVGQLGYYTHWMDSSLTDLLHLGVRFYEPGVGRFGQVDPAGEGLNWYGYGHNTPQAVVDPDGRVGIGCRLFTGNRGTFIADKSCKGKIRVWVLPESGGRWITPVDSGKAYDADAFSVGIDMYKLYGSATVKLTCQGNTVYFNSKVNVVSAVWNWTTTGYEPIPWNFFLSAPVDRRGNPKAGDLVR